MFKLILQDNRCTIGNPDFPSPTEGGWGASISPLIGRRENRKDVRKLFISYYETISVNYLEQIKIVPPVAKNTQSFEYFRKGRTSRRKTSIISGTIMVRANPKTAFERELDLHCNIAIRFNLRTTV